MFSFLCGGSPVLATSSLSDYFLQSNLAGQVIVVILLIFSVVAWGVMFCKYADLKNMSDLNADTLAKVRRSNSLIEAAAAKSLKGPCAALLRSAMEAWGRAGMIDESIKPEAKALRIAHVENSLQRTLARQLSIYNSKMTLLGTIISGAPFLGLLGTVWGVMDSFGSMSGQSSVTLQQLAPGVAGALLTTVAGLVVAIPSVFGYNFLTTKARQLATETEIFASMIADKIEMESAARAGELLSSESKPSPAVAVSEKIDASPSGKIISFSLDDDVNSRDSD